MTTLTIEQNPRALRLEVSDESLSIDLVDGRRLVVPLHWYPRLEHALPEERSRYELWDDGAVLAWQDLDEHIEITALIAGKASGESKSSFERWKGKIEALRMSKGEREWVVSEPLPDWWTDEE